MSLLNDLKKLLFGAKSVAKSGADRASDAAREKARDWEADARDAGREGSERAKEIWEDFSEKLREEAGYAVERGRELKGKAEDWLQRQRQEDEPGEGQNAASLDPDDLVPPQRHTPPAANENIGAPATGPARPAQPRASTPPASTDPYADLLGDLEEEKPHSHSAIPPGQGLPPLDVDNEQELLPPGHTEEPDLLPPPHQAGQAQEKKSIDFEAELEEPAPPREPSAMEELGDQVLDKAARAGNEAKEAAERAGRKIMEASGEIGDKIRERAEEVGGHLKNKYDDLVESAQREAEKDDMDETIRRAKEMEEQSAARARVFDDKEQERDTKDSTLGGMDNFWDRADRFAKGDYTNEGGKKMRIQQDPEYKPKEKPNTIHGFEDRDNDGDDLIDDAILDEDDK